VSDNYDEKQQPLTEPVTNQEHPVPHVKHASIFVPFVSHLEAMGFLIGEENGSLTATHPQFDTIFLTEYENGIIFEIWYKPTNHAKLNRTEYLEFVNQYNNDVPLLRATARNEEQAFVLDKWLPGSYDRDKFDIFIKLIIAEITGVLFQNPDYSKFLEKWTVSNERCDS
jgi:hypothetical protein